MQPSPAHLATIPATDLARPLGRRLTVGEKLILSDTIAETNAHAVRAHVAARGELRDALDNFAAVWAECHAAGEQAAR